MNAVQAMPCGGDLRVNISRNTVEISDTGQGIKKEHIGRIFEPFFSEKEGGTGIGLPIAAGIIEGAGGKISVESTEGKGSRFKIEF
jgi:signal transduction histidine kinase